MEKKPIKKKNEKPVKSVKGVKGVKSVKEKKKEKPKKEKEKKENKKGISVIYQRETKVDTFYDKKVQNLVKKLKDQDKSMDNNLRFGWKD